MKKILALILSLGITFSFNSCNKAGSLGYRQISMNEAKDIMASGRSFTVLDVRRPDEFAEGHIPNAINLPLESIKDTPPNMLPDKDMLILVYCRSGRRSKEASEKLVGLGYTNIFEFGGILDWDGETEK